MVAVVFPSARSALGTSWLIWRSDPATPQTRSGVYHASTNGNGRIPRIREVDDALHSLTARRWPSLPSHPPPPERAIQIRHIISIYAVPRAHVHRHPSMYVKYIHERPRCAWSGAPPRNVSSVRVRPARTRTPDRVCMHPRRRVRSCNGSSSRLPATCAVASAAGAILCLCPRESAVGESGRAARAITQRLTRRLLFHSSLADDGLRPAPANVGRR